MTALRLLVAASLLANLVFGGLAFFGPAPAKDPAGMAARAIASNAPATSPLHPATAPNAAPAPGTVEPAWSDFLAGDFSLTVERLRAAGFPERMVRAIVSNLVWERFADRERRLMAGDGDTPYWRQPTSAFSDPERMKALNQLNQEQSDVLRKLFGEDFGNPDSVYRSRTYGDLPDEKVTGLQKIDRDTYERRREIVPPGQTILPSHREALEALEATRRAEMEKLLTPQELADYDLRNSTTARMLRSELQFFNATEAEYRAIFALRRQLDEQFPTQFGALSPEQTAARTTAEARIHSELAAALGPERSADYEHVADRSTATLNRIVARFDLPLSAARATAAVQKEITRRAEVVRADVTLPPDRRAAELAQLAGEAKTRIGATLGPRGLEAYTQYAGTWLNRLTLPTPPPPR